MHSTYRALITVSGAGDYACRRLSAPSSFSMAARLAFDPPFIGRAPEQVDEFLAEVIDPIRNRYASSESLAAEVKV